MATQFPGLEPAHIRFVDAQMIFFVGSAAPEGRVNVSPKGMDSLRVLGPNQLLWRNLTGSGNETAGHLRQSNRLTLMWCGFDRQPLILRAFGRARAVHPGDAEWDALNGRFPASIGARQVFDMEIDMVQSSCGYAVPFFDHAGPRDTLETWTEAKGPEGIRAYWHDKNRQTIDGAPTGIDSAVAFAAERPAEGDA